MEGDDAARTLATVAGETMYAFRIEYFSPVLPLHLLHILLLQARPLSKMNPGLALMLSKNLSPNTIINTETSSFRSYFSASVTNDNQQISSPSIDTLTSSACLRLPPLLFSCLLYTSPSPRDATLSRMPSSA